ncbi:MAG TPA: alkaline phosphatase family protein [Bryobacteraceae bacterium]|jgi:phospholipase C|nr:alkaline phosphatase family protein [Bryobacteraceae bacterium]
MQQNQSVRSCLALLPVLLVALLLVSRAPTQPGQPPAAPPGLEKIRHFVFIMQENRSFDHYFGTYPGAEGIPASKGLGPRMNANALE